MSNFIINELSQNDWREYKSIRLKSMQDSPDSFASTYEQEASFTPDKWKSRLRISPSIHDALALSASAEQAFVGLLSGVIHTPETGIVHLYQMWVAPEYRGMGVGTALVDRIKFWASQKGTKRLRLSVTTINTQAISLYQSIGFIPTGNLEPLREGSSLKSQEMEIMLN